MHKLKKHGFLALLGILMVTACDESTPTEALLDDALTADEVLALEVLADEGSVETALEFVTADEDVATTRANLGAGPARAFAGQARIRFMNAQDALRSGDRRRALDEAKEARRLLARALMATGGNGSVLSLIEWIESQAVAAGEDTEEFDDPAAAIAELERIAAAAREALAAGDTLDAGQRALLGDLRARLRRRNHDQPGDHFPARARLKVALAGTSVALAERLVGAQDTSAGEPQLRYLAMANRMLEKAQEALGAGRVARAVHFAELAHWSALKAVVLPGGVTEEDARAMLQLANTLFDQAEAALGAEPTEIQGALLQLSGRFLARGAEMLEAGHIRGIAPLWHSAVISRWLIG